MPAPRHTATRRPRIVDAALASDPALIVLRGGGGAGKSVAAAQIAREFAAQQSDPSSDPASRERHSIWIRCSPDDRDTDAFWQKVFASFVEAGIAEGGTQAEALARGGIATTSIRTISTAIACLNAEIMMVLDDFHHIVEQKLEDFILEILECCPYLRMVLTSRAPLARLTAAETRWRLPVREVDATCLALTGDEIKEILAGRFTDLPPAGLDKLADRILHESKGWPLAVQTLALETEAEISSASSPAIVSLRRGSFVRHLVDQMLSSTSQEHIDLLSVIALFSEVSVDSLARILEMPIETVERLLNDSLEPGLDYWDDESGTRWYRHHDLVKAELRGRAPAALGQERLRAVFSRAATAFRSSRPRLAMEAALIAQEWELLSELLCEGSVLTLSRVRHGVTLHDVPKSVLDEFPVLAAFALMHEYAFPTGKISQAINGFRVLASRTLVRLSGEEGVDGIIATILRMVVARLGGLERIAISMAQRALHNLSLLRNDELQRVQRPLQIGINQIAITFIHAGHYVAAVQTLEPFLQWEEQLHPDSRAHMLSLLAWAKAWSGEMPKARALLRKCEQLDVPVGWKSSYIGTGFRIATATDLLEHGNADDALHELRALDEHAATIEHWPFLTYLETLIIETQHGNAAAIEHLGRALANRSRRSAPFPTLKQMLASLHARLQWHAGRILPLSRKRSEGHSTPGALIAALSRSKHDLVATIATAIHTEPRTTGLHRVRAEVLLLQAMSALRDEDDASAVNYAQQAVSILHAYSLSLPVRVLPLEVARSLKELAPGLPLQHSLNATIRDVEPLTAGERRALIAVAQHGNIADAAQAIHLSPSTVKSYMKHVYRKLGVNKRRDALRVAASAGLLLDPDDSSPRPE